MNSSNLQVWYKRALVKLKMDDIDGCLSDLREAIRIDKDAIRTKILEYRMNWHESYELFKNNYFAYDFSFCFVHNYNYSFSIYTIRTTTILRGCCKKR
jgi:hypothetical protein